MQVDSSVKEGVEPGTPLHRRLRRFPRADALAALFALLPYPVRRRVSSPRVAARRCPGPSPVHSGGCGHTPQAGSLGANYFDERRRQLTVDRRTRRIEHLEPMPLS